MKTESNSISQSLNAGNSDSDDLFLEYFQQTLPQSSNCVGMQFDSSID